MFWPNQNRQIIAFVTRARSIGHAGAAASPDEALAELGWADALAADRRHALDHQHFRRVKRHSLQNLAKVLGVVVAEAFHRSQRSGRDPE